MNQTRFSDRGASLSPERWLAIERLFNEALERDAAARAELLERCGDEALRREVASLLEARELAASFIQRPALLRMPRSFLERWAGSTESSSAATDSGASEPALPERIGPYRLLGLLGRGGMGSVYRGRHEQSGRQAAVKTVRVPGQRLLQGIRREIRALARLRHPGIVRILDDGVQDGLPWYAMELLEGTSLRARLDQGGMSVEAALSLMQSLCSSLAFLHGEGVVHRDLKPDNILITGGRLGAGGTREAQEAAPSPVSCLLSPAFPVIVDFGLAAHWPLAGLGNAAELLVAREVLEVTGRVSGTAAYMAPEQARGEPVDARADLYSLGCILFELLAGRPPFSGRTWAEVLYQHCHVEPTPPSAFRAGLAPQLDALVLGLLRKEPHERLGYAGEVAAELAALLRASGSGARDPGPGSVQPAPPPRDYLYRPRFQGRGSDLEVLARSLERLHAGRGGLVLLGGESGSGKTRLAMELAAQAQRQGLVVLTGEGLPGQVGTRGCDGGGPDDPNADPVPPPSPVSGLPSLPGSARAPRVRSDRSPLPAAAGGPLEVLRKPLQAIADRCLERGPAETACLLGPRAPVLALYEPALGRLPGQSSDAEGQAAAPLPPDAARLRLYTYLTDMFTALAADRPLLLLLDDLHWADQLSLGFLDFAARSGRLAGSPVLIVGTYRPEEADAGLEALSALPAARRLLLGPLDEADVGAIVADMLAMSAPPAAFVRSLAQRSEGNPFFAAEYLRAAVEEGSLRRDEAGRWTLRWERLEAPGTAAGATDLPPRALRDLVGRRLARLPQASRDLVQAAAVLGREAEADLLARVAGLSGDALAEALAEPLRRLVLEEAAPGGFRFLHDTFRQVAYEQIPEPRRRLLHLAAARAIASELREAPAQERGRHLAGLASHWAQAGDAAQARECFLAAARAARDRYAFEDAERLYGRYLQLVEGVTAESVHARLELAWDVLRTHGRSPRAAEELRPALDQARGLGDLALEGLIATRLGGLHHDLGQFVQAGAFLDQALEIARQLDDAPLEGQILGTLVLVHHDQGRLEEARAGYERVLAIARSTEDLSLEAKVLTNLANLVVEQGRLHEGRRLRETALALYRRLGDRPMEGLVLMNLAGLLQIEGRLDEARPVLQQALAIHREVGARRNEGLVLSNLATLYAQQGRMDEACAAYGEALEVHREVGARRFEAITLMNLANAHCDAGRPDQSKLLYRQALPVFRDLDDRLHVVTALRSMATMMRLWYGDLDAASRLLDEMLELLPDGYTLERGFCLCALGHLELALGRSGRVLLEDLQRLAASLEMQAASPLGDAISRLERAQAAFDAGTTLFRGSCVEDLPEPLRRRIEQAGEIHEPRP
jgi:serine/threonine protein kinase/tetratricopeptide (TPR) repeat protein